MKSYRKSPIVGLLRCGEVVIFVFILVYFLSTDFISTSNLFLRRTGSLLISTPFIFLIGNIIVLTLFANSKQQQQQKQQPPHKNTGIYVDDIHRMGRSVSMSVQRGVGRGRRRSCFRRSRSDHLKQLETSSESKTMVGVISSCPTTPTTCSSKKEYNYREEEDDDEKLRRRFEAFIAKQKRFIRDEECL